jgi:hypothetical protein
VQTAYWLYKEKGWSPYKYLKMPYGEKVITRAFFLREIEELEKEQKELEDLYGEK